MRVIGVQFYSFIYHLIDTLYKTLKSYFASNYDVISFRQVPVLDATKGHYHTLQPTANQPHGTVHSITLLVSHPVMIQSSVASQISPSAAL